MKTIETKVIAAAAGAGGGGVVSGFLLWLLGVLVWHVPSDATHAVQAAAAVPAPVSALVALVLVIAGSFLAGYSAPHTPRPDLNPPDLAPVLPSNPAPSTPADVSVSEPYQPVDDGGMGSSDPGPVSEPVTATEEPVGVQTVQPAAPGLPTT